MTQSRASLSTISKRAEIREVDPCSLRDSLLDGDRGQRNRAISLNCYPSGGVESVHPTNPMRALLYMRKPDSTNTMNRWAVILAGGDGTRLLPLTRRISGDDRPKQFCSLFGGPTLLELTKLRVGLLLPPEQTITIVTRTHERFYNPLLNSQPDRQMLVQPNNKGTAAAIILGLLRVTQLSPDATIAFFPSDHYVSDDVRFMSHVESAFSAAQEQSDRIVLLGIKAESPEVEFGWIEPQVAFADEHSLAVSRVRRFWEKPSAETAQELLRKGCLWNSFVMVGRVDAFVRLTQRVLPELCLSLSNAAAFFGTPDEAKALLAVYDSIQPANFSTEVLTLSSNHLLVSQVSGVCWSDLGEPARALSAIRGTKNSRPREDKSKQPKSAMSPVN